MTFSEYQCTTRVVKACLQFLIVQQNQLNDCRMDSIGRQRRYVSVERTRCLNDVLIQPHCPNSFSTVQI